MSQQPLPPRPSVQGLLDRWYPDELQRDPIARLRRTIDRFVERSDTVIDLGAGAGEVNTYDLRGRVARVVGVDLNHRVVDNPLLDEGRIGDLSSLPFDDASFDLGFSIYVLEHVAEPDRVAAEIARVLRPGGHLIALTPSKWHYVALIAAATPTSFHKWANARRGRNDDDTFETQYRMNTRAAFTGPFNDHGLETVELETFEVSPNYLTFSVPTFVLGTAWERTVNRFDQLAALRVNMIGVFRKTA